MTAFVHPAHAFDERVRRRILEHETADAEPDRFDDFRILDGRGEENRPAGDARVGKAAEKPESRDAGHPQVEQEDIRNLLLHGRERRVGVGTRGRHDKIRLALQQLLQPLQDDRVIVDEDQADRHGGAL